MHYEAKLSAIFIVKHAPECCICHTHETGGALNSVL